MPIRAKPTLRSGASIAFAALCLSSQPLLHAETRPTAAPESGSAAEKKLSAVIREFPREFALTDPTTDRKTFGVRIAIVFLSLANRFGVPIAYLGKALPALAERTVRSKDAPLMERAAALFLVDQPALAEQAALQAGDEAHRSQPRRPTVIVEALQLAACAAIVQRHYGDAHKYLRVAMGETHPDRDLPIWAEVQVTQAHLEWLSDRPEERITTLRRLLTEHQRVLGYDHTTTLRYHNEYATALYDHRKDAEAEKEFRAILAAMERNADPEEDTPAPLLAVRKNLARVIEAQGRYKDAFSLRQSIVEDSALKFGKEHPDTIYARLQFAFNLADQERHAEATAEFEELLELHIRVLGKDAGLTLSTRSGLAWALLNQGRKSEALTQFRVAHTAAKRVFGPENEETLTAAVGMGVCLNDIGQSAEAEKLLRDAVAIRSRVSGPEHKFTLEARDSLGVALAKQKKWQAAEKEYRFVLAVRERNLGPDHEKTLSVRNHLAILLNSQGYAESALDEHRAIVSQSLKINGPDHPQTLRCRDNLATALNAAGKSDAALKEARAVLADHERIEGPENPSTLDAHALVGIILGAMRRPAEAEKEFRHVFETRRRILGEDDPNTNLSRVQFAHVLAALDRLDESLHQAIVAYEYLLETNGANHHCTTFAKNLIEALQSQPSGQVQFDLPKDLPTTINEPLKLSF